MSIEQIKKYAHVPGLSPVTMKLIDMLKDGKHGMSFTDKQLQDGCGKATAPGEDGYASLSSAIRYVERHYKIVWRRERAAGSIRCLSDVEALDTIQNDRRSAGRKLRRACDRTTAVNTDNLPDAHKSEHNALSAQLRGLRMLVESRFTHALEKHQKQVIPSTERLLEAFTGNGT